MAELAHTYATNTLSEGMIGLFKDMSHPKRGRIRIFVEQFQKLGNEGGEQSIYCNVGCTAESKRALNISQLLSSLC